MRFSLSVVAMMAASVLAAPRPEPEAWQIESLDQPKRAPEPTAALVTDLDHWKTKRAPETTVTPVPWPTVVPGNEDGDDEEYEDGYEDVYEHEHEDLDKRNWKSGPNGMPPGRYPGFPVFKLPNKSKRPPKDLPINKTKTLTLGEDVPAPTGGLVVDDRAPPSVKDPINRREPTRVTVDNPLPTGVTIIPE